MSSSVLWTERKGLSARWTLQPTNQDDDADDRRSDANFENAVPVAALAVLAAHFSAPLPRAA